jgi:SagB-type dehydrogenase family enzyme
MHLTRYPHLPVSAQNQGLPQPPLERGFPPDSILYDLPAPAEIEVPEISLRAAIEQRRSLRKYSQEPLSLAELSFLLWCTQGVKQVSSRPATLRTVPSAGARHAFETYLLINRVEGVAPGLYRYISLDHAMLPLETEPGLAERFVAACTDQRMVSESCVSFFWAADTERMEWRYPVRGYRYLLLDAGHICQNLYLAAEAVQCGACAIAAFDDDLLNQALGIDGEAMFAAYAASVGKKLPKGD